MPASGTPILIVNADDFGWDPEATDRAMEAFAAARITSATALVHMEDSDRAARLALEAGLPVGLHLNLTDRFTDPSTSEGRRGRHLRACNVFSSRRLRLRRWIFDPRIRRVVDDAISDQLERFEELYGKPPTHVDGHKHVHVCPNVALASPLASIAKMRDDGWAWPTARTPMGAARAMKRYLVSRRFLRTRVLLDIWKLRPELGSEGSGGRAELARRASVEVMAHPGFPHERRSLMSSGWGRLIEGLPTGSYRELA
jgi:predicted glycoside hydrolase/deacetylase ChbG (UPF0249 family)